MLSAVSFSACTPIGITYSNDPLFHMSQNLYAFADGFNMYISPLLFEARDVALNKDELVILSDYISLEDCIDQNYRSDEIIQFSTTIYVSGVGYWYCDGQNILITPDKIDKNNIFTVQFNPSEDTAKIIYEGVNYLTFDNTTKTLNFQTESQIGFTGVSPQIFNYIVDGDNLVLFTNFAFLSGQYTITYNTSANTLSATRTMGTDGILPDNSILIITERPDENGSTTYKYGRSNWVQYKNNTQDLSIKKSLSGIYQNILISTPYKQIINDQFSINVNGLKNHLTPDCEINIDKNDNIKNRDYYNLCTGSKQKEGHDNIFVMYEGNTQGIRFEKDRYTAFHYPNTSQTININDTTISLNGAIAGSSPFKSDKVFKKQNGYKKYSNWGESLPIYNQNGTWLCTWLSGNSDSDTLPVWVDRYLNPSLVGSISSENDLIDLLLCSDAGKFINTDTLSSIEINGNSFISLLFSNYQQAYVDVVSQFTFDPGVLYVYHHIGEDVNRSIVSNLSGDTKQFYLSGGAIKFDVVTGNNQLLYVSNWLSSNTLDNSQEANNIAIVNSPNILTDEIVQFNSLFTQGSAYGITLNGIDPSMYDGITLSVNIYADDWSDLYGDQIIGNSFDGGIGIFVNNPILTPIIYMYEITQGRNLELNSDLYILQESKLSNLASASAVNYIFRRDYDEEYIVIDSGKNILKYDSANILLSAIPLSSTITGTIYDAQIDGIGNIYILASTGAYKHIINTGETEYIFNESPSTRISIDLDNNLQILPSNIIDYCVDSENNIFTVSTSHIYKNGNTVFSASNIKDIYCDIHDNIWVIHDNKISKLTNIPYKTSTTTLSSNGSMSMTMGYNLIGNGVKEEFIVIVDETNKRITKLNTDNQILYTSSISSLSGQFIITGDMSFRIPKGDSTGYDYQRKYGRVDQINNGIHVKVFTSRISKSTAKVFKVYTNTSNFTKGWHNFTTVFDTARGNLKLYVDGVLTGSSSSDINAYQHSYRVVNYRNEPRFIIGTSSAKNGTICDRIRQPLAYIFNGGINEVRLYNNPIADYNIKYVARNGFSDIYDSMTWNMPIGTNQYIEEIERFFQHRPPGNKSQFFNLKIRGYTPSNDEVKELFESSIRQVITKIVPAHTQLKDIVWLS